VSVATHDTTHVADAQNNLVAFLRNKTNLNALINVFVTEVQAAEDMFWNLLTQRYAFTNPPSGQSVPVGQQLDGIGDILVQPRGGLSDALYILQLLAKIAINAGSGRINDILNALNQAFGTTNTFKLVSSYPAQFIVLVGHAFATAQIPFLTSMVGTAKAAGVGGLVVYQGPSTNDNQVFKLDTAGQGLDQGKMSVGVYT
jgi:hypothetical protein